MADPNLILGTDTVRQAIDKMNKPIAGYIPMVDVLPTPDETQRGRTVQVKGGVDTEDLVYTCRKLADNTYAWVEEDDAVNVVKGEFNAHLDSIAN